MKKLLLLVLTIGGLASCGDKQLDEKPSKPSIPIWGLEELAAEYGIDTKIITILGVVENDKNNETHFIGVKDNKLWIADYEITSKKEIKSFLSNKDFSKSIEYDEPYVGKVIDTISIFIFGNSCPKISEKSTTVYSVRFQTKKNKILHTLLFCVDGVISKYTFSLDFNVGIRKWYNNTILSLSDSYDGITRSKISCYSMEGELYYNVAYDSKLFRYNSSIPLNNIYECITWDNDVWDNDVLIFKRVSLETSKEFWNVKIDLNIPETARYKPAKYELIDANTMQASYNITLYDGTKTTKTVNIDVTTGEYTLK